MSRPPKSESRRRHTIRFLDSEWAEIRLQSDRASLTTSEYVRRRSLGHQVRSKVNSKAIAKLSSLGGLQKLLLTKSPDCRVELNEVLRQITCAIKELKAPDEDTEATW